MTDSQRIEWLKKRKLGIGGSDISAVAGVNPWKTAWDVYMDKTDPEVREFSNRSTHWGHILEPIVADEFGRVTNSKVRKPELEIMSLSDRPHIMASLDRIATMPDGEEVVVEIKTSSGRSSGKWGEPMTDQIPVYYLTQVHYQMGISGYKTAYVPVLIDTSDFRIYKVDYDESIVESLFKIADDFWKRVTEKRPPSPDANSAAGREIIKRFEAKKGVSIDLPVSSLEHLYVYEAAKKEEAEAATKKEQALAELLLLMGDAQVGRFPSGGTIERRLVERKESVSKAGSYYKTTIKTEEK
mgnify:FL=1